MGLDIPKQPPISGCLEMYCPHTKRGRSDCLRCIVINQKLLATCNSFDAENWCEKTIYIFCLDCFNFCIDCLNLTIPLSNILSDI